MIYYILLFFLYNFYFYEKILTTIWRRRDHILKYILLFTVTICNLWNVLKLYCQFSYDWRERAQTFLTKEIVIKIKYSTWEVAKLIFYDEWVFKTPCELLWLPRRKILNLDVFPNGHIRFIYLVIKLKTVIQILLIYHIRSFHEAIHDFTRLFNTDDDNNNNN